MDGSASLPPSDDNSGVLLISHMAELCRWDKVQQLLEAGADPLAGDQTSPPAMHFIVKYGQLALLSAIVEKGCSVTQISTSLRTAILAGHADIASFLLAKGATYDPKYGDDIDHALVDGFEDCIVCLLEHGMDPELFIRRRRCKLVIRACELKRATVVASLLRLGVNPRSKTVRGLPLLHLATKMDAINCMEVLLRAGVEVDISTGEGDTPLHTAASNNAMAALRYLVAHGAPLDRRNSGSLTPLHAALQSQNAEAAKALISYGADVTLRDQYNKSAIHWAAYRCLHADVLRDILAHGGHPNDLQACSGGNSLHCLVASRTVHTDVMNLLLEHGANPCHVHKGQSVLAVLCARVTTSVLSIDSDAIGMLLAAGAAMDC